VTGVCCHDLGSSPGHTKKSTEQVQHRAIRWIQGVGPHQTCSITQLRKELELQTLEERRLQQRLILFYKVINGEVVVTVDDLGQAVDHHVAYFSTGTTGTSCINTVTPFATQQDPTVTTTNQLTRCRISFSGATCQFG